MAETVVDVVGNGSVAYVPWPKEYERDETGDFWTDISKLCAATGWQPKVSLRQGLEDMFEYYKEHKDKYLR